MELTERLAATNRALDVRDLQAARSAIGELFAEHPNHPKVLWTAGRFLGLLKSYGPAAAQFKLAVQGDPLLSHVEFEVAGRVIRLRDIPGSSWAADVLDEFARGMYGIAELSFAPDDVVVDVGAHIGGVSVILAALHPDIRIIAYEPASSNYAMLVENVRQNGISNVTTVQQAVMGERGQLKLTWAPHATAGSTVGLPEAARASREASGWTSESVECVTLDDVFQEHGIARCSWLKLDCEGAEWGIMEKTGVLERIDRISLELHLPASRQSEGLERCVRDFSALVNRVPRVPRVVVSSTLWVGDL
ncbi:MAG: FkbM family methyltransferase [Gemmatimonadaceae bacterium]